MSFPGYPAYKDSGVEWLGEVPGHWSVKALKRGADVMPSNVDKHSVAGEPEVFLCNYTDVYYNECITSELEFMRATATARQIEKFTLQTDDVLVTKDSENLNDIGVPAHVPNRLEGVICGYHLAIVRPTKGAHGRFLKYFFESDPASAYLAVTARGLTRVGLSQDALNKQPVAWPPGKEQENIASFLDHETARIDALIEEQKRLIELLKEKRQAVISHAVTKGLDPNVPMKDSGVAWLGEVPAHWDAAKLGFYADLLTGYPFPSSGFSNNESDVALLRGANVGVSYLKWDDTVYWPVDQSDEFSRYLMRDGQIVIGMDRPWIGEGLRIARVRSVDTPCLLLQRVAAISSLGKIDENYLFSLFDSGLFKAYVEPDLTGVSVPHISPEQILGFVVPLPPMSEQIEIAKYIDEEVGKTSKLLGQAEVTIDLLVERRSALISAAVTGKIDVRDWQPPEGCSRTEREFSEDASA